jgi:HEAT repeat protein
LSKLGADAKPALPELIHLFRNQETGHAALGAQHTLGELGIHATDAIPALLEPITKIEGYGITARERTPFIIAKINIEDMRVLAALKAALRDKHDIVRLNAAVVLWKNNKVPDDAFKTLVHELSSSQTKTQVKALKYLASLGPGASGAIKDVRLLCLSKEPETQLAAMGALVELDPKGAETTKLVTLALLESKENTVREGAAYLLGRLGPLAKDATVPLQKVAKNSKDAGVRMEVAFALWKIESKCADLSVAILIATLTDHDSLVREASANRLGQMGPAAIKAVSHLERACKDSDEDVRQAARRALMLIGK